MMVAYTRAKSTIYLLLALVCQLYYNCIAAQGIRCPNSFRINAETSTAFGITADSVIYQSTEEAFGFETFDNDVIDFSYDPLSCESDTITFDGDCLVGVGDNPISFEDGAPICASRNALGSSEICIFQIDGFDVYSFTYAFNLQDSINGKETHFIVPGNVSLSDLFSVVGNTDSSSIAVIGDINNKTAMDIHEIIMSFDCNSIANSQLVTKLNKADTTDDPEALSAGAIVGIVAGVVVGVALIGVITTKLICNKKGKEMQRDVEYDLEQNNAPQQNKKTEAVVLN